MELSVKEVLERLYVPPLQFFARTLGLPRTITRKGELIDALVKAMEMEVDVEKAWRKLDKTERRILAEVAHNGGSYDPAAYRAKYLEWCPTQLPDVRSVETSLVWLFCSLELGRYVMPQAVADRITKLAPELSPPELSTLDEIPNKITGKQFGTRVVYHHLGDNFSVMELGSVLNLIKSTPIRVNVSTLRPTGNAVSRLADALIDLDFSLKVLRMTENSSGPTQYPGAIRPHAWAVLVQQCSWCKPAGDALQLTDRGAAMLSERKMEEFRKGVRRFIENDEFDELHRINGLEPPSHYAKLNLNRPSARRRAIWKSMKTWPQNRWMAFDEIFRYLVASGSGFNTYQYPFRDSRELGSRSGIFYTNEYVDRLYLLAFLFESLGTLGLLDLGYTHPAHMWTGGKPSRLRNDQSFLSRYDGLLFIRLNPLGIYCLGLADEHDSRATLSEGLFRVLSNHEIVVERDEDLPPTAQYMLRSIGKQTSPFLWRLDEDVLLKFLESGGRMKEVVDFLDDHEPDGLPENVRAHLDDMSRKAALVLGSEEALIIETADEHVAAEVAKDRRTSKFCKLVHNRFIAVSKRDLRTFRNALRKLGYVLRH